MSDDQQTNIPEEFLSGYVPSEHESLIHELWETSGMYNPDTCIEKGVTEADAEPFSIVLPPPNVTGTLHSGHAMMLAIEDTMVRYQRMLGKRTLWIPGTDHAAISTEAIVVKQLKKEKTTKFKIGREAFMERVNDYAKQSQNTIVSQTKKMGASLDWSREAFTLDTDREKAVFTAFKTMYDDGLIYRGDRIVNWDPKGQTTVSDDEVNREEATTKFYYFSYGPFTIGTARPETKFADKYIIVHPGDERYEQYEHMQTFDIEWINGPIIATLIKDEAAKPELGTGAMTITPWHSQVDFELAEKYDLPKEQIIDFYGKLLPIAGEFKGMKIDDARDKIVAKLDEKGLLVKVDEKYVHQKALSERTKAVIEPQVMKQWWIDVNKPLEKRDNKSLKELMLESVGSGSVDILPDRFEKIYYNWIENLRDWNISRQIWYGHQVPVWYNNDETMVSFNSPGDGWVQDTDTLDTWFSSGLWTFSTLGWPEETSDLKTYHPTSVLETGHDIIFFWVARMILMSTYLLDEVPFKTVYMHGMVLDKNGKKMSKSNPETAVDPLHAVEEFGADALRMAMLVGVGPGQDVSLGDEKIKAYKKFANKIWNATRFVLENVSDVHIEEKPSLDKQHEQYIASWHTLLAEITEEMNDYKLYLVAEKLYHQFWHEFADKVIEECKDNMNESAQYTLLYLLTEQIKALHPFMPFLTEAIWQKLPAQLRNGHDILMVTRWPDCQ